MSKIIIGIVVVIVVILAVSGLVTITFGPSVTSSELERFFEKHRVEGYPAAALKKRSVGKVIYLATIHGYPDNLSVCNELVAPFNRNPSLSAVSGTYFCEELR